MCGLVGILRRDGRPAETDLIDQMLAPMLHRGPDDRGHWADRELALGHLRLSILDLSDRAHQPIEAAGGEGVLVYNGEVYNQRALRTELEGEGLVFTSSGDTEVVLQALRHWGPRRAIPRFNGMFAFAYFDRRSRELWLARDRLGIKPLYYAELGSALLFASDPQALLAHPDLPPRPDRLALASFVLRGMPDPRWTFFEGIEAIESGTWWRMTASTVEKHRYYSVDDALDVERLIAPEPPDKTERLEEILDESVRLHLSSDVPLATICSGGVDSSLITALASRRVQDLHAYVVDTDDGRGEGEAAQRVADHLGIGLTRVRMDRETHLRLWPEAIGFSGFPCHQRNDVSILSVALRCRSDGVKVLLNGEGSDELFGGYRWHARAYKEQLWHARLARRLDLSARRRRREIRRNRLREVLGFPGIDGLDARRIAVSNGDAELRKRQLHAKLEPLRSAADRAFLTTSLDDLYLSLDPLLRRHDSMSMAASLEMRVPYLENALIDFAIHLPRRSKFRHGQAKWILKQVAGKWLPADIVHARKRAFPIPGAFDAGCEALLQGGVAGELLHWTQRTQQALISLAQVDERLRLSLVGLELWGRLHLRGEKAADLANQLLRLA